MAFWMIWTTLSARSGTCGNAEFVDTLTVSSWNTWGLPAPITRNRRARFASIDHAGELGDSGLAFVSPHPLREVSFQAFGTASSFDRWKRKGVLAARTELRDGSEMLVIDTHFQSGSGDRYARDRAGDVDVLLQVVADWDGPVVAAGDFNFYDDSLIDAGSADRICAAGFEDVALALGRAEATHRDEDERFDRVYVRNGADVCVQPILFDVQEYEGVPLSDHQRVEATVAITRAVSALTMN